MLGGAPSHSLQAVGDRGQSVGARTTLPGALPGEPSDDAGRLGDRAGVDAERDHDARSEPRPKRFQTPS